ncbi:MAG: hypothetical protein ACLFQS_11605 [Bacteroidales bacterium]
MRNKKEILKNLFLCLFPVISIEVYAEGSMSENPEKMDLYFSIEHLENPVPSGTLLVDRFEYRETDVYEKQNRKDVIYLENGYAAAKIRDVENFPIDKERYSVAKVEVIYTKYPLRKEDWITNYYELLARRLEALFSIDSTLNSSEIEWSLVSQTECTTAHDAKNLFHGIALYLEPLPVSKETTPPVTEQKREKRDLPPIIENMGFITKEEKHPDQFKSPIEFGSTGNKKRQMDPKDLQCPTWR